MLTERVRTRLVRWFLRHGIIDADAAANMLVWENSRFSIDAKVCVHPHARPAVGFMAGLRAG